jgi:di- and tripeptidase
MAWSSPLQTLYIGCQNTSIQWIHMSPSSSLFRIALSDQGTTVTTETPEKRYHKFFDSHPQYERKPPGETDTPSSQQGTSERVRNLYIPAEQVVTNAHYGYVYCMATLHFSHLGTKKKENILVSGSGDESVKVVLSSRLRNAPA